MVGFGAEDEHFVSELTYNYGVGEYRLGNDILVRFLSDITCKYKQSSITATQQHFP